MNTWGSEKSGLIRNVFGWKKEFCVRLNIVFHQKRVCLVTFIVSIYPWKRFDFFIYYFKWVISAIGRLGFDFILKYIHTIDKTTLLRTIQIKRWSNRSHPLWWPGKQSSLFVTVYEAAPQTRQQKTLSVRRTCSCVHSMFILLQFPDNSKNIRNRHCAKPNPSVSRDNPAVLNYSPN